MFLEMLLHSSQVQEPEEGVKVDLEQQILFLENI